MTPPVSRKKLSVAVTGEAFGFASRKYVWKSPHVKPSAKRQVDDGLETAVASCPPVKFIQYIARSAKTGCEAVTTVPKLAPRNCGSELTGIVSRLLAASVYGKSAGGPSSLRSR